MIIKVMYTGCNFTSLSCVYTCNYNDHLCFHSFICLKCHLLLIFLGVERNVKESVPLGSLKFGVCLQEKLPLSTYNAVASRYTHVLHFGLPVTFQTVWKSKKFSRSGK